MKPETHKCATLYLRFLKVSFSLTSQRQRRLAQATIAQSKRLVKTTWHGAVRANMGVCVRSLPANHYCHVVVVRQYAEYLSL